MPSLMKLKNGCGSFALAANSVHGIWHTSNQSAPSLWDHCYLNLNTVALSRGCLPRHFSTRSVYRGSYMSAHVLLNLLNELGKRDKMRGLPSILSLFRNEFNKFNNTRARMLDSIYHMTNSLKSHFWRKNVMILSSCTQRCYGRNNVSRKSINH